MDVAGVMLLFEGKPEGVVSALSLRSLNPAGITFLHTFHDVPHTLPCQASLRIEGRFKALRNLFMVAEDMLLFLSPFLLLLLHVAVAGCRSSITTSLVAGLAGST